MMSSICHAMTSVFAGVAARALVTASGAAAAAAPVAISARRVSMVVSLPGRRNHRPGVHGMAKMGWRYGVAVMLIRRPLEARKRHHDRPIALDRHWLRSIGFTLALVGLVAAALGADWWSTISSLVTCAVGFGFFYLLFPGGAHFGMTVANFLALYACLFQFFREANFPAAPRAFVLEGVALPVLA